VNRYRRQLLNYCRRLLPEARAEDVVQQALLKTWIALRGGAEVRDIKAWLYRVVHNTAVNALRDGVHDGEPLVDPTLRAGAGQADLERGLALREALAEVAALPRLQREVIVRTAVGGDSHEQVASDLGITDGAVRGLLYRARATLRTATTALTPVSWITWLVGRAEQGTPASERLSELAAGGGTAGLGGLLLKGGIAAVTAGTLITGAAVVHLEGHPHHHATHELAAAPGHLTTATVRGGVTAAAPAPAVLHRSTHVAPARSKRGAGLGLAGARVGGANGARDVVSSTPVRHLASTPSRSTAPVASAPSGSTQGATVPQSAGSTTGGGSTQNEAGTGQSGTTGASQGEPVGSAAGSSSETAPSGSTGGSTPAPPAGESPSGSDPSGTGEEGSGTQSGSGESGSSSGGQSGGVVGTVVHEVGSLLEHLLH